jgi:5-methylcytosine-specific restriction endonuclease McrA
MLFWTQIKKEVPRCPCCQRIIARYNGVGGHILSYSNGGETIVSNGLYICRQCNNNDQRHMFTMMKEEWGEDHHNTKIFVEFCKYSEKNYLE